MKILAKICFKVFWGEKTNTVVGALSSIFNQSGPCCNAMSAAAKGTTTQACKLHPTPRHSNCRQAHAPLKKGFSMACNMLHGLASHFETGQCAVAFSIGLVPNQRLTPCTRPVSRELPWQEKQLEAHGSCHYHSAEWGTSHPHLEGREPPLTLRQEKQYLYFGHPFPLYARAFFPVVRRFF